MAADRQQAISLPRASASPNALNLSSPSITCDVVRTACDLHLHSTASAENDEWYSLNFGCPESYAEPRQQYELCKARGMDLVTLTDHDTIAGGLTLIDNPDFFLSEEISTQFPENGAGLHVLAWNITPDQHERIQAVRSNVYDLVELLRGERIAHGCAHPLFSPNGKLSVQTLEKILVLFPIVEGINGLTDRRLERDLRELLAGLDETAIRAMAQRHGLEAVGGPRKIITAGSDDHSLRHCASCFTVVDRGGLGAGDFVDALVAGEARCHGHQADLNVMCLTAGRITYGFLNERKLARPGYRDPFLDLVDVVSGRETGAGAPSGMRDELVRSLILGASRTATPLGPNLDFAPGDHIGDAADAWVMNGVRRVHDGLIGRAFDELLDGIGDLDMYRVLGSLRDLAAAASTAIPFLMAADHFARQRQQANGVLAAWDASPRPEDRTCLAIFSDSVQHVDGVTSSLRTFVQRARAHGRSVRIPYCGERPADADDVYVPLTSASTRATELYEGMEFHLPSLLGTIDWLWRQEITHVELATPGPMGLIGLLAARLLRLPVTASYHTEIPALLQHLSSSALLHTGARKLAGWFYGAVDRVFAFSEASRQRLIELGVPAIRIEYVPVAIDPEDFSPAHACTQVYASLGVDTVDAPIVLTVGRLSREKNLPVIIQAVGRLQGKERAPTLVIVGDGPEREVLKTMCADKPYVVFVGLQQGDVLRRLYASASAFVFASQIDTLGLATMEAMSSGVPVLVPSDTAIAELVIHGISGYCYEFGVDGLVTELEGALGSPARNAVVAANGRKAMVERWTRGRFADVWDAMAGGA
jgi:glycosyltransferase involved in cell wall biosynthesis